MYQECLVCGYRYWDMREIGDLRMPICSQCLAAGYRIETMVSNNSESQSAVLPLNESLVVGL